MKEHEWLVEMKKIRTESWKEEKQEVVWGMVADVAHLA